MNRPADMPHWARVPRLSWRRLVMLTARTALRGVRAVALSRLAWTMSGAVSVVKWRSAAGGPLPNAGGAYPAFSADLLSLAFGTLGNAQMQRTSSLCGRFEVITLMFLQLHGQALLGGAARSARSRGASTLARFAFATLCQRDSCHG